MKKTAKIRILAWLMVICLLVPELSLNAFAYDGGATEDVSEEIVMDSASDKPIFLTETNIDTSVNSARIGVYAESDRSFSGYLGLYFKKSADKEWTKDTTIESIYSSSGSRQDSSTTKTYYYSYESLGINAKLDAGTAYDYIVVFADKSAELPAVADVEKATEMVKGGFTTLKNEVTFKVNENETEIGRYDAKLVFDLDGEAADQAMQAYLLIEETYVKDDKTETSYICEASDSVSFEEKKITFSSIDYLSEAGNNLASGTEYKYKVAVSSSAINFDKVDVKDVKNVFDNSFTTKADNRKVVEQSALEENTSGDVKLVYAVSGYDEELDLNKNPKKTTDVVLLWREKKEGNKALDGWTQKSQSVHNDNAKAYATFNIDIPDKTKTYEYIVGVWDNAAPKNIVKVDDKDTKSTWHFVNSATITDIKTFGAAAFDASIEMTDVVSYPTSTMISYNLDGETIKRGENVVVTRIFSENTETKSWEYDYSTHSRYDISAWMSAVYGTVSGKSYIVRIAVSANAIAKDDLAKMAIGTNCFEYPFTAPSDERYVSSIFVDTGYNDVEVNFDVYNKYRYTTYWKMYYKKSSEDDTKWDTLTSSNSGSKEFNVHFSKDGLDNATAYDYVLVLSDSTISKMPSDTDFEKDVLFIKKGTFATKNADYTVSFNKVSDRIIDKDNKETEASFKVQLKAESDKELDNVVFASFKVEASEKDVVRDTRTQNIKFVKNADGRTYDAVWTAPYSLSDNPNYVYTIKDVTLYILENGKRHKVKTLEGIYGTYIYINEGALDSVSANAIKFYDIDGNEIKDNTVKLNSGSYGKGIQYMTFDTYQDGDTDIVVARENTSADKDKYVNGWTRITKTEGDTDAVYVDSSYGYDGTIRALTPGTVKITFTYFDSEGNETDLKAVLTVEVKDFRPFYEEEVNGVKKELSADPSNGKSVGINAGTSKTFVIKDYTKLPVATASGNTTFEVKKPGVASVNGQAVTGLTFGKTDVVATTAEGFKVLMVVSVKAAPKGIMLYDLVADDSNYPAILKGDVYKVCTSADYKIVLKETPDCNFGSIDINNTDYDVEISDNDDNNVQFSYYYDELDFNNGDPNKIYTITISPKNADFAPVSFKIQVLDAPNISGPAYAIADLKMKKLGDVPIPEACTQGVVWCEPATKLDGMKSDQNMSTDFWAKYEGETYYPLKKEIKVYYDYDFKPYVSDTYKDLGDIQNNVVQVMGVGGYDDVLDLTFGISSKYNRFNGYVSVVVDPVKGLIIDDENEGYFKDGKVKVWATKKGNYTLKATYYYVQGDYIKPICKTSYKFTAVDTEIVNQIALEVYSADGVKIAAVPSAANGFEYYDIKGDETVQVVATAYNRNYTAAPEDRIMDPAKIKLSWASNDKTVADFAVKTPKDDSTKNTLKLNKEGNTYIQVTALDKCGVKTDRVYVENINVEPIVEHTGATKKDKITVNLAYDFASDSGKNYAVQNGGYIVIAPKHAYGDTLISATLYENGQPSTEYKLVPYGKDSKYIIVPDKEVTATGNKTFTLKVNTKLGKKEVTLNVEVINKTPDIKAKASKKLNLFYKADTAEVTLTAKKTVLDLEKAVWNPAVSENTVSGNRFVIAGNYTDSKGNPVVVFSQEGIDLQKKGKGYAIADTSIVAKPLSVKIEGYKDLIPVNAGKDVKLSVIYKNGALKADKASVCTALGIDTTRVWIKDSYLGKYLRYAPTTLTSTAETIANPETFELTNAGTNANLKFTRINEEGTSEFERNTGILQARLITESKKSSEKTKLTLYSNNWVTEKTVSITVKNIKPKVELTQPKLVYNTRLGGAIYELLKIKGLDNKAYLGNYYDIYNDPRYISEITDAEVKGTNKNSQALINSGALEIGLNSRKGINYIDVRKNYNLTGDKGLNIKDGNYSFKITPVLSNGTKLNTVILKINITSKAPTVTVKVVGKLDAYDIRNYFIDTYGYYDVSGAYLTEPKFKNVPTSWENNYNHKPTLVGDYAEFFNVGYDSYDGKYHVAFSNPGMYYSVDNWATNNYSYKLSLQYTGTTTGSNDAISVTSKPVTIKTVQKAAKIKVLNTVTMYRNTTGDDYYAYLLVSNPWYQGSGNGTYDVDKDGEPDIYYYYSVSGGVGYVYFNTNSSRHMVHANFSKASYSIPIEMKLKGRDDISADVKVNVKVTVK